MARRIPLVKLSDHEPLRDAFNGDVDKTRLVILTSPT